MLRLILLLAALACAYLIYTGALDQGVVSLPEPKAVGEAPPMARHPDRGLNPFVLDGDHAAPPQRPRAPDAPASR